MNYLVFYTFLITVKYVQVKLITDVDRCTVCYAPKEAPYIVYQFDHRVEKQHASYVTASGEVKEILEGKDLDANLQLTRCASKEQLDTCELYTVLRPPVNVCIFISSAKFGFSEVFKSFSPPLKCPIFGNYTAANLSVDFNALSYFPLGTYYWRIVANGFYKKKLVGSICIDFGTKEVLY